MISRSLVSALALVAVAACASGNSQDPVDQRVAAVADGHMIQTDNAPSAEHAFDAPATTVWTALQHAYASLEIATPVHDPALHRMGNTNFYKYGRLNGEPISRFADCGMGPTGARANSSRVYFSMITIVTAVDATHTKLATDVTAVAVDMSGTTNARITCGSTGQLETTLYDLVASQLGGG